MATPAGSKGSNGSGHGQNGRKTGAQSSHKSSSCPRGQVALSYESSSPGGGGEGDADACMVCCEAFGSRHLYTVTSCGHDGVCSLCMLKMRALGRDKTCPMCKAPHEYVVCVKARGPLWSDFPAWNEQVGPDHVFDPRGEMYFPRDYFRAHVEALWAARCRVSGCGSLKRDAKALAAHLKAEHQLQMCGLCQEHRHVFPAEQKQYTQAQYEQHLRKGDGDGGQGHPNCEFCRKRYYDKTALFTHLSQDHHTCHLCEREGLQFKYYNEYRDLEGHYRSAHHLCDEGSCLAKRYVVFSSVPELNVHTRQWHPLKELRRATLQVEFGLKDKAASRAGGGGGGGDYEAGLSGRANGGEWQLQVQELEERTRRAAARESGSAPAAAFVTTGHSVAAAPDDYPALAPAPGGGGGASGWAGAPRGGQGRGRGAEDFPTLGGGGGGGGRGGEGRAVQAYGPGTSRAQQQESPLGVTLGALAGKQSKLREQEQRKAAAKQAAAQAAAEAAALKQSFRQAVVPNEGGPLAVRIHRGEVPSNHGAAPPPAPAAVATHVQQAPKAKVVTLGAARARNSIATAASKASGGGGGWGSALGSMGVQSSSRSGISGVIRHAPAPAPAPAQLMHSSHSSSGSLDRLADGADKPAPPLQGLDLGSMYFKGAAGPPPGLQAGAGADEDWEPYDPTAFAPQGGGQEDAFPGLPAPPPPSSSLAGAKSGGTAPSGSAFVRALAQQPKPTPQGQGQGQGQPKKSLGTKGTKKKAQALQDLAFLR